MVFLILSFQIIHLEGYTQKGEDISTLTTPSAPAFTILGLQPNEIARPKSFNAMEASLLSSFTSGVNFIIPRNYALEFSPYWFRSHPTLSFKEYVSPSVGQSLLQNLSVSLATTTEKSSQDTTELFSKMGIGFRTQIFTGKASDYLSAVIISRDHLTDMQKAMMSLKSVLEKIRALSLKDKKSYQDSFEIQYKIVLKLIGDTNIVFVSINLLKSIYVDPVWVDNNIKDPENVKTKLKEIIEDLKKETEKDYYLDLVKDLESKIKEKWGFILEINAAMVLDFPTNDIGYSQVPQWGIWIIPTYRLKSLHFEFIGMIRYLHKNVPNDYSDNIDLGGKLVYQSLKFSITAEGLYRYQSRVISKSTDGNTTTKTTSSQSDYRLDCCFEYKIADKLSVNYTIGKNFNEPLVQSGNLISTVGLNFGIGGPEAGTIK
jgi:hypothetical protein